MEYIDHLNNKDGSVTSELLPFEISYYKSKEFFTILDNYIGFIKGCESFIRKTRDYTNYIAMLKDMGLTHCQVLGNIDSSFSIPGHEVSVEMHHGPIFTLFDYCACVITYALKHDIHVNTPIISKIIMDEHWNGNIQTVMLSSTVHQAVDSGKLFINLNQAHGNLNNFLKKYKDGLTEVQIEKINKYIELSKKYKSTDNGLFDIKESIHDWSKRRYY